MWTITGLQFTRLLSVGFFDLCYCDTFDESWQVKARSGDSFFLDNHNLLIKMCVKLYKNNYFLIKEHNDWIIFFLFVLSLLTTTYEQLCQWCIKKQYRL